MQKIEWVNSLLHVTNEELENQLRTLKSKINLLEGQLESQRRRTRSVEEERDEAVKRLAASLNEFEGLKSENKNLKAQIASLRKQFEDSLKPAQVPKPSVKDRVKERVESERKKDSAIEKAPEHRKTEPNFINVWLFVYLSWLQAEEIAELRREIRSLREAKEKSTKSDKPGAQAAIQTSIDQTTTDGEGNVQTIRIQLENAKDRKLKNGRSIKQRRIRKVFVESEESSSDQVIEEDSETSDSTDEDYEEFIRKAKKVCL
jgi:hypothetical protein